MRLSEGSSRNPNTFAQRNRPTNLRDCCSFPPRDLKSRRLPGAARGSAHWVGHTRGRVVRRKWKTPRSTLSKKNIYMTTPVHVVVAVLSVATCPSLGKRVFSFIKVHPINVMTVFVRYRVNIILVVKKIIKLLVYTRKAVKLHPLR